MALIFDGAGTITGLQVGDGLYWASRGDTTKLDEYYAACEAVKAKYPKPA